MAKKDPDVLWYERKRNWCGTKFTFTTYTLTKDELTIKEGFLHEHTDIIKTYRILDVSLDRTLGQRMAGLSSIKLNTMDRSTNGETILKNITHGKDVLKLITKVAEESRRANGVTSREFIGMHPNNGGPMPVGPGEPGGPDDMPLPGGPYGNPDDGPDGM